MKVLSHFAMGITELASLIYSYNKGNHFEPVPSLHKVYCALQCHHILYVMIVFFMCEVQRVPAWALLP